MANHSSVIKKIKSSIAFISVYKSASFISQGSGFVFWKNGVLVTCNHVIPEKHDKIFLQFPSMKSDILIDAKVVHRNIKNDLAILEFEDKEKAFSPLKLEEKKIQEGTPVIFSGYPLGVRTLTTHQGILSSITEDPTGLKGYLIDGTVNKGNSGCPLMTEQGKVIGVVNATHGEEKDLLDKVTEMQTGIISLHGIDLIEIYQALIKNLQLGIGYAVPCAYIPKI